MINFLASTSQISCSILDIPFHFCRSRDMRKGFKGGQGPRIRENEKRPVVPQLSITERSDQLCGLFESRRVGTSFRAPGPGEKRRAVQRTKGQGLLPFLLVPFFGQAKKTNSKNRRISKRERFRGYEGPRGRKRARLLLEPSAP